MSQNSLVKSSAQLIKQYQFLLEKLQIQQIIKELFLVRKIKPYGIQRRKNEMIQKLISAPVQIIKQRIQFYQRHSLRAATKQYQLNQQQIQEQKSNKIKTTYENCFTQDQLDRFISIKQLQQFTQFKSQAQLKYLDLLWKKSYTKNRTTKNLLTNMKQKYLDITKLDQYFSQEVLNPYTNKLFNTNRQVILPENELTYFFNFPMKTIIQEQFSRQTKEKMKKHIQKFKQIYLSSKDETDFNVSFFYNANNSESKTQYYHNPQKLLLIFTAYKHFIFIKKKFELMKAFTQISFRQGYNLSVRIQFLIEEYSKYKDVSKSIFLKMQILSLNAFINLISDFISTKKQNKTIQLYEYILNLIKTIIQRPQIQDLQQRFSKGEQIDMKTYKNEIKLLFDVTNLFKTLKNEFKIKQAHDSGIIFRISNILQNIIQVSEYFNKKIAFLHLIYGVGDKHWAQKIQLGIINFNNDFSYESSYISIKKVEIQQFLHKNFRIVAGFQKITSNNESLKPLQICKFVQKILNIYLKYPESFYISQNFIYDIVLFLQHELKTESILKDLQKKQVQNQNRTTLIQLTSFFSLNFSQILFRNILQNNIKVIQNNEHESKQQGISSKFMEQFLIRSILTTEHQIIELNQQIKSLIAFNKKQKINKNQFLLQKCLSIIKVLNQMHKTCEKFHSFLQNTQIFEQNQQTLQNKKILYRLLRLSSWVKQLLQSIKKDQNSAKIYQQAQIMDILSSNTAKLWMQASSST